MTNEISPIKNKYNMIPLLWRPKLSNSLILLNGVVTGPGRRSRSSCLTGIVSVLEMKKKFCR